MTAYWFKLNRYGYGARPITWQRWALTFVPGVVMAAMALLVGLIAASANFMMRGAWAGVAICIVVGAITAIWTIRVARRKTDGEWRWRWGGR
jgi:uncharacterized membrane protein YqjE